MLMEKIYSPTLMTFTLLLLFSCSVDFLRENLFIEGEQGFDFMESKNQWDKLKKKNGNSYQYTLLEESWTGTGSETTIVVEEGVVTGRYYNAFAISEEDGTRNITDSYEEILENEIGQHSVGAPPYTMDVLNKLCISEFLIADPNLNTIFFDTNGEGVMLLCGFVPSGCVDDCFRGIKISQFSWK